MHSNATTAYTELCITPVALHWTCNPVQKVFHESDGLSLATNSS